MTFRKPVDGIDAFNAYKTFLRDYFPGLAGTIDPQPGRDSIERLHDLARLVELADNYSPIADMIRVCARAWAVERGLGRSVFAGRKLDPCDKPRINGPLLRK